MEPAQLPPAPERALPQAHFYSIEYPGYVRQQAVPQAVQSLGGQHRVDRVFKRTAHSRADALIELALHPDNPFAHPIPGDVVPANNLLLKVTRRRRKRAPGVEDPPLGDYTAEVVGVLAKTARFRSASTLLVCVPEG